MKDQWPQGKPAPPGDTGPLNHAQHPHNPAHATQPAAELDRNHPGRKIAATRRSRGRGAPTGCSRGGRDVSSSPPTPSWRPRSATSSASTSTRPETRSCSAWTRSPRSRRSTAPSRSSRSGPGLPEKATHDYKRNGTTTLFAALESRDRPASPTAAMTATARPSSWTFSNASPGPTRAASCTSCFDNYHTHKHDDINPLAGQPPADHAALHPDVRVVAKPGRGVLRDHHPPSHPPRFLRQRQELITAIRAFIDAYNHRCQPFIWTKTADEILPRTRQPTSDARH